MNKHNDNQAGFGALIALIIIAVLAIISVGVLTYQHHKKTSTIKTTNSTQSTTSQPSKPTTSSQQAPQWKVYTSSEEKATLKYPGNWTLTKPYVAANSDTADATGIASPSGAITISWVSAVTGFGNEHSSSYPLITVVDKTPISGAPGYFVVSGVTTLDGTTYHPWIAVQDANGILTSGVMGDVATFQGKHNLNASTGATTGILFSTSGLRTSQNTPSLAQAQATAWFSGSEAQQAKQILLSFSDPN